MNSQLLELPLEAPAPAAEPAFSSPSERLSRAAALLGGRLAELLRRSGLADGERPELGCAFLERMAATSPPLPAAGAPGPLDRLAAGLGLCAFELDLLVLAGLGEEHEGYADVYRWIHPQHRPWPTLGLAAQVLLPEDSAAAQREGRLAIRRLVEGGPARRAGLFRLEGDGPFFDRAVLPAPALWSVLHGIDAWPDSLQPEPLPALDPAGLEEWLSSRAVAEALLALRRGDACTLWVAADDPEVAYERAVALALAAGRPLAAFRLAGQPSAEKEELIALHCLARGLLPLLLPTPGGEGAGPTVSLRASASPAPILVASRPGELRQAGTRPLLQVAAERLGPADLGRLWASALPEMAAEAPRLAAAYPVESSTTRQVAADLDQLASLTGEPPGMAEVAAAIRCRTGISAGGSVQLIRPRAGWEHLVLPPAKLAVLREAVARLLNQRLVLDEWKVLAGRPGARGVRLLFAGPPGTGKTFSAEVLASALGVDLLVVDLSRVLSKWIGETEKNLAEVFATAEKARAVLLFDEADALFGKRTEVQDAHDRYANLETAYLLSRLEKFDGLAILATNLRQNLDQAFVRRLEFLLEFEEPGREERQHLWQRHLPGTAPLAADVDFAELAGLFPLVGGLIKNAAVAAAFLAAGEERPICREHLVHAIRREYEKAGKAFPGLPQLQQRT
jgi:hypothetical protein